MISKIRKYQDSWLTKAILALTALSFMSLFGISGYVNRAGKNRAVIKVDNMEILQDEMNNKLQNSIRKAKDMFGGNIEISDETRKNILSGLVKQNAQDMIIARQAQKVGANISDELIEKIISSQPEFMDASGRFSPALLHRQLAYFDMTENEYISDLKQSVLRQHIIYSPVDKIAFPKFMNKYVAKITNQEKIFQYVTINPADMKIDRNISEEEIEQYYQDFAPQFEEPESRDVAYIELKTDKLAANMEISEEDIASYYKENIADYVVPEKRQVLQMVFDDEHSAKDALKALQKGEDFYQVAANLAHQDKETTFLGEVTEDSMLQELSDAVFDAKLNEVVGPLNTEFGWHVLKVSKIIAKVETPLDDVRAKIAANIRNEQAYDQAQNIINAIEDEIGQGADLDTIAKKYNAPVQMIKGLKEDGSYVTATTNRAQNIIEYSDFNETAFSYNEGEISQTIETDEGFIFSEVKKIHDAHIKDLAQVKDDITKIWIENEKSAIAQEVSNDVLTDMEGGDKLSDIASRFKLQLKTTAPVKRGENFAGLNSAQSAEAYQTPLGGYKSVNSSGTITIVAPIKVINANGKIDAEQQGDIATKMNKEMEQNLAEELINSYAKDMDVRIKYKLMGLED